MDAVERKILENIESHREEILGFARDLYSHGELGFKEKETARKFAERMKALGLRVQEGLAVTGVKAYLNPEKKDQVSLGLIGEMDALRIPNHKCANPATQAAHCCGHHCQMAGILGAALALSDPEVAAALDGQVVFFAVPAEEYGEVEFKNRLREEGKIRYGGGKCELIRIGAFEDIDLSIVHHSSVGNKIIFVNGTNNGFVSKVIRYKGTAAHAAGAPHLGVNALHAATLGLTALQYLRDTFQDKDHVRIHPIITRGGDLVNVVPEEAVVETLVRAGNKEALEDACRKTDRAFFAGGAALGAAVEIETLPGYLPTLATGISEELVEAARTASDGKYEILLRPNPAENLNTSSTDVGDLQHVQPVCSFRTGGIAGRMHSADFDVVDEELAYLMTAKIFALGAYRFLKDGAKAAKKVVEDYRPVFTREEYVAYMDSQIRTEVRAGERLEELAGNKADK